MTKEEIKKERDELADMLYEFADLMFDVTDQGYYKPCGHVYLDRMASKINMFTACMNNDPRCDK